MVPEDKTDHQDLLERLVHRVILDPRAPQDHPVATADKDVLDVLD